MAPPPLYVMEKSPVISETGSEGRGEMRGWGGDVCALLIHLESQVWEPPPKPFTRTSVFGLVL